MPGPVAMPACGKRSATYCRIAAFSVSTSPSSVRSVGTSPSGLTCRKSEPSFCTTLVLGSTSLDDLSAATGMNRPSLYGAFGDKRELYIKAYQRYRADARAAMTDIFRDEQPIRQRLERIFAVALDIYLSGDAGPRGCFTVMTAASEAVSDPEIRAMVLEGFYELDKAFAACFPL